MKISVVGTGYVGLVSGVCLAQVGHTVVCVDVDKQKVDRINRGDPPIYEKGLDDLSDTIKDNWNDLKKKSDSGKGRYYMQKSDPFGNDVIVLPPYTLHERINTGVRRAMDRIFGQSGHDKSNFV